MTRGLHGNPQTINGSMCCSAPAETQAALAKSGGCLCLPGPAVGSLVSDSSAGKPSQQCASRILPQSMWGLCCKPTLGSRLGIWVFRAAPLPWPQVLLWGNWPGIQVPGFGKGKGKWLASLPAVFRTSSFFSPQAQGNLWLFWFFFSVS